MKNAISTIFRKELARFFGDKRMAFTTILLPGLMIFLMYNFMGSALTKKYSVSDDFSPTVEVINLPAAVENAAQSSKIQFKPIDASVTEDAKKRIADQKLQLLAIFPANFDTAVAVYDTTSGIPAPNVELYFNSASTESQAAYSMMIGILDSYESSMANKFDFNAGETKYDLATDQDTTGSIFSSMLPLLLMIFLFSGCMAVAPESIAGEKERGTIATLLITPARRSDIAFGKIGALSVIALLGGASSALGTILSLPKLMGSASQTISNNVYGFKEYLMLALIILSTVLLLITVISIVSAFARSVKEAQTYVTPMMLVVMMLGITAMFGNGAKSGMGFYLIPLYNSVQSMIGIFSFKAVPAHIAAAVISNLLLSGAGVYVLTRMFNSERVMFSK